MFCGKEIESMDHVLLNCWYVWRIWVECAGWWGFLWVALSSVSDLLQWWRSVKVGRFGRVVWELIPCAIIWFVWIARNERLFKESNRFGRVLLIKLNTM